MKKEAEGKSVNDPLLKKKILPITVTQLPVLKTIGY